MRAAKPLTFAFLILSALTFVACGSEEESAVEEVDAKPLASVPVETVKVESTSFVDQVVLRGTTRPVRRAEVSALMSGRIQGLKLVEGARVDEGDVAFQVDARTEKAQRNQERNRLRYLESELSRTRKLLKRGLSSEQDVKRLEQDVRSLRDGLHVRGSSLRDSVSRVPIQGVVDEVLLEPGEFVSMGQTVAKILDTSTLKIEVGLRERDIREVKEGREVRVRFEALDEVRTGRIVRIGQEADTRDRTFPMEVEVGNADGFLRAGMRANVVLSKGGQEAVTVIPRSAVLPGVLSQEVMVVEGGSARAKKVKLGRGAGPFVMVKEGLTAGDELVIRGHRTLLPGAKVEVVSQEACCAEPLRDFLRQDEISQDHAMLMKK